MIRLTGLALTLCIVMVMGCEPRIDVQNTAPQVTAVGPVAQATDGQVSITIWLRDHETQPVDLTLSTIRGESETELTDVGGHGLVGLTTSPDPTGRAHTLLWTPDGISADTEIQLKVDAVDSEGQLAPVFTTAPFRLQDGLPAP